jgi:hypothetical protein
MIAFLQNILIQNKEFKLFGQKNNYDCGYAICACLDQDYNNIVKQFPENIKGASTINMHRMISSFMPATLNYIKKDRKKLRQYKKKKGIYLIREKNKSFGHWVLQDRFGNIYDTETVELIYLEKYDRRNDDVIAIIEI